MALTFSLICEIIVVRLLNLKFHVKLDDLFVWGRPVTRTDLSVRVVASIHKENFPSRICVNETHRLLFCFAVIRQDPVFVEIIAWLRF